MNKQPIDEEAILKIYLFNSRNGTKQGWQMATTTTIMDLQLTTLTPGRITNWKNEEGGTLVCTEKTNERRRNIIGKINDEDVKPNIIRRLGNQKPNGRFQTCTNISIYNVHPAMRHGQMVVFEDDSYTACNDNYTTRNERIYLICERTAHIYRNTVLRGEKDPSKIKLKRTLTKNA